MNLDSLITVASLFIAVYAILPRVRRLEISLRFGMFGWMVVLASFVAILYLQFYQTFHTLGLTHGLNLSRWSITTSNASFIVLLCMVLALYTYLRVKGLSRSNVTKFREFVFELSRERRYSELFSLIERHLNKIERIYYGNFIGSRLRDYFEKNSNEFSTPLFLADSADERNKSKSSFILNRADKLKRNIYRQLAAYLPSYERKKEVAKEIIHEVLVNRNTVNAIASIRPYFALQILEKNFYENSEFVDIYLKYLAEDTKSVLYHEIRNNQNLKLRYEYELPKRNRLLNFLFEDCRVAERYGPYKPIGEFVITELDKLYAQATPDLYNEPIGAFQEDGQWESELLVGIRFFDIMVTSALYQNIKWHMWLYYYPCFVERIVRNLSPNEKLSDPHDEWPTKYHYALYEITSCLCKWVSSVDHIPLNQENVVLGTTSADHENGNIPKSSMLALGQITEHILTSVIITDICKQYIMDIVYQGYFDLRQVDKTRTHAEALINAIRCGRSRMIRVSSLEYSQTLLDTFEAFDRVPYEMELSDELRKILTEDVNQKEAQQVAPLGGNGAQRNCRP